MENSRAKINRDVPFQHGKAPENGASRPDIVVLDKEGKTWILIEGTLRSVASIEARTRHKDEKYRELRGGMKRIYKDCKVPQKNVLDFLGGYHTLLEQEIHSLTANHQETQYLIKKSQKWILCQNAEILKKVL